MNQAGVLPDFAGIAVHDGWKPYQSYEQAIHALCSGHHLRELLAASEQHQTWALGMTALLLDTHDAVQRAEAASEDKLTKHALEQLHASYRTVIELGYEENPGLAENAEQKMKRTDAQNLLLRLDCQQAEALLALWPRGFGLLPMCYLGEFDRTTCNLVSRRITCLINVIRW